MVTEEDACTPMWAERIQEFCRFRRKVKIDR
jgi:hypothetical protein